MPEWVIRVPRLPYRDGEAGWSSGWQGTQTSHERALASDANGTTLRRQQLVLEALGDAGATGMTALEMRVAWGETNPNKVSPSCTVLHKAGLIARLQERRGKHHVYVLPQYVGERPEEPFKHRGEDNA